MVSAKSKVIKPLVRHMRPAPLFVAAVTPFRLSVTVGLEKKEINAKSIMSIMTACIKQGSEIEIRCDGEDEEEALTVAVTQVESGLGELGKLK